MFSQIRSQGVSTFSLLGRCRVHSTYIYIGNFYRSGINSNYLLDLGLPPLLLPIGVFIIFLHWACYQYIAMVFHSLILVLLSASLYCYEILFLFHQHTLKCDELLFYTFSIQKLSRLLSSLISYLIPFSSLIVIFTTWYLKQLLSLSFVQAIISYYLALKI